MAKATVQGVGASDVRNFFRSHKAAFKALPAKAQATVRPQDEGRTLRGRLAPEAIDAYNKANPTAPYVTGVNVIKEITFKGRRFNKSGVRRVPVTLLVSDARDHLALAGIPTGERGTLSAGAVEALEAMHVL